MLCTGGDGNSLMAGPLVKLVLIIKGGNMGDLKTEKQYHQNGEGYIDRYKKAGSGIKWECVCGHTWIESRTPDECPECSSTNVKEA